MFNAYIQGVKYIGKNIIGQKEDQVSSSSYWFEQSGQMTRGHKNESRIVIYNPAFLIYLIQAVNHSSSVAASLVLVAAGAAAAAAAFPLPRLVRLVFSAPVVVASLLRFLVLV